MSLQDAANEEKPVDNVVYMADFILRQRHKLVVDANELIAKAQKLSKKEDPRQDPFASVLMKKVDGLAERVEGLEKHLRFIVRGGNAAAAVIPARGYQTGYPIAPPPPVKISVSMAPPIH